MSTTRYFIAFVLFSFIGFLLYNPFLRASLAMVNNENIELISNNVIGHLSSKLVFAVAFGIIPVLYSIIEKHTVIQFFFDGAHTLLYIIGFGILSWIFRIIYLYEKLDLISSIELPNEIKPSYSIEKFCFQHFLLLGFFIGAFISFQIFRIKKKAK